MTKFNTLSAVQTCHFIFDYNAGIYWASFACSYRARFNVPPNTLWVISGMGFYGSDDPTNSIKAL